MPDHQPELGHKMFGIQVRMSHFKAQHGIALGTIQTHGNIIAGQVIKTHSLF